MAWLFPRLLLTEMVTPEIMFQTFQFTSRLVLVTPELCSKVCGLCHFTALRPNTAVAKQTYGIPNKIIKLVKRVDNQIKRANRKNMEWRGKYCKKPALALNRKYKCVSRKLPLSRSQIDFDLLCFYLLLWIVKPIKLIHFLTLADCRKKLGFAVLFKYKGIEWLSRKRMMRTG